MLCMPEHGTHTCADWRRLRIVARFPASVISKGMRYARPRSQTKCDPRTPISPPRHLRLERASTSSPRRSTSGPTAQHHRCSTPNLLQQAAGCRAVRIKYRAQEWKLAMCRSNAGYMAGCAPQGWSETGDMYEEDNNIASEYRNHAFVRVQREHGSDPLLLMRASSHLAV
ncbi:hypothetical protein OH76DRAFT_1049304 [Lentinus brumalis]|uniref:Uncharacterized protein n=1 Tax=Lentinus brumalis TaxID=2498619 RepID=A0A371CWF3_9APHY|nr:hypothetical protein OH76DRAFT_1049304 [Polyporus brumalis]